MRSHRRAQDVVDVDEVEVVEVVLVEEPFVVVKYLLHPEQPATPLDLRRVTLMRVSEAYVKALRPAPAIGPSMDDLMRAIDRLKDAVVAAAELDAD